MTDTQSDIVAPNPRHRWWAVPLTVLAFVVVVIVGTASLLPASLVAEKESEDADGRRIHEDTPYAITPGGAQSVDDRVVLDDLPDDVDVYPPTSDIYFVTISEPAQSMLSWFVAGHHPTAWLSHIIGDAEPVIAWLSKRDKYGDSTPQEVRQQSLQQMASSEDVATYVALSSVGYDATLTYQGLQVQQLVCLAADDAGNCVKTAPSADVLEPGDIIVAAKGEAVMSTCDLTAALDGAKPGDRIDLTIKRGDAERDVTVELVADSSRPERAIIGFVPNEPVKDVELPFELDIDTGQIGGPSAGTAFTLTLIDELTPGDLLGGGKVAVTGTMSVDGAIGAIGGLPQKVEAVRQAGVDTFLVPAEEQGQVDIDEARAVAGDDVEVIPVATLTEALDALEARGGDPVDITPLDRCAS